MRDNRGEQQVGRTRLLDRVEEAVVSVDETGRCRTCNQQAEQLLDRDRTELSGEPVTEAFPGEAGGLLKRRLDSARATDEPVGFETELSSGTVQGRVYADEAGGSIHFERAESGRSAFDQPSELLAALVDDSSEAIFLKDTDGVYRFANDAAAEVFGEDPTTIVGKTDEALFGASVANRIREVDERVMETGESESYEASPEIDGVERVFQTEKHPYYDNLGAVRGVVGISREVTQQRERERELERQEFLFERAQEIADIGVWEYDPTENTTKMSTGTARIYGLDEPATLTRREAIEFYHPEDRPVVSDAVDQALQTGEWPDYERRIVRSDGDVRDVRVRGEVITDDDGDVALIRGVAQDITERKDRERALERKNERLDEFASVISHDLRNPLAVAKGNVTMLSEDDEAVVGLEDALDRMESIIDDTLELAKQGETVSTAKPIDLRALVENCWEMVETSGASVVLETETMIEGDYERLRQVFENLFANSIEHGSETVTVRVGVTDDTLYVADDGSGIPPDERETAFEPGHTTSDRGTGFGLAIVERIAQAHGWTVRVTESDDGGARFEFSGVELVD